MPLLQLLRALDRQTQTHWLMPQASLNQLHRPLATVLS